MAGKDTNPLPKTPLAASVAKAAPIYRALTGFNYGKDRIRVDAGCDLPAEVPGAVIKTLLRRHAIVEVKANG